VAVVGLDHVQIAAPPGAEAQARRFYGDLLGLPELAKPPALAARGGVWFALGAQQLHVGVEAGFAPARKAHPALAVDDLDALAARLAQAGAPVAWDEAIPDVRRLYTEDPWGNRLELTAADPVVLTQAQAVEALAFLVTAARTQLDEAAEYAPMRLMTAARRLADPLGRVGSEPVRALAAAIAALPATATPTADRDAYVALIDGLCVAVADCLLALDRET